MQRFTLLIPSRNDVDQALELVADMYVLADEIVIVDASEKKQKKKLLAGAKKYGKKLRVIDAIALGYSEPLRAYAHKKCTYEWVLRLDTDERITEKFKKEIKHMISNAKCNAFAIKVYDMSNGKKVNSFFAWQIQIYKKSKGEFKGMIHEQPIVSGTIRKIEDDEVFIEHYVDLEHTGTKEYPEMEQFQRMSYRAYNATMLDHASKLMMPENRTIEGTPLGGLVKDFLLAYEKITFRKPDEEISDFDYFAYYLIRESAYSARSKDPKVILNTVPWSLHFYNLIQKSKKLPYSREMFEISKVINDTGVIKFLHLDDEKVVEALVKKYRNKKQGVGLLISLLLEQYRQQQKARKMHFNYENIIVSPHIDDAVFSLGGLLSRDKDKKQKVVDVFSKSKYTLGSKADGRDVTEIRKEEERNALRKVGADVEFLDIADTSMRPDLRKGDIYKLEKKLTKYLGEGRHVYFPLAIGGHGDHVALSLVGIGLLAKTGSDNIYFYEDLPYAFKTTATFSAAKRFLSGNIASDSLYPLVNTQSDADKLESEMIDADYDSKLEMCRAYKSQVDWRIIAAVMGYGRMLGAVGGFRERIWRIRDRSYLNSILEKGSSSR